MEGGSEGAGVGILGSRRLSTYFWDSFSCFIMFHAARIPETGFPFSQVVDSWLLFDQEGQRIIVEGDLQADYFYVAWVAF